MASNGYSNKCCWSNQTNPPPFVLRFVTNWGKLAITPVSTINVAIFTKQFLQSLLKFHSVDRYRKLIQTTAELEFASKSLLKFASVDKALVTKKANISEDSKFNYWLSLTGNIFILLQIPKYLKEHLSFGITSIQPAIRNFLKQVVLSNSCGRFYSVDEKLLLGIVLGLLCRSCWGLSFSMVILFFAENPSVNCS